MKMTVASRIKIARFIAVGADVLQLGLFPLFAPGFISPVDDALDVIVCVALTYLLGWHYGFLPSFIVKVVPFADLVPTWTIAVFLATSQKQRAQQLGATEVYVNPPSPLPPKMQAD